MKPTALSLVRRRAVYPFVLTLALGVVGCASNAPTEQMALAKSAVNDATGAGAAQYAPVEFRNAMEKMNAAERALGDGDHDRARMLAEEAEVDARLASAKARSTKAQTAANALQENIRVLRQEVERSAP